MVFSDGVQVGEAGPHAALASSGGWPPRVLVCTSMMGRNGEVQPLHYSPQVLRSSDSSCHSGCLKYGHSIKLLSTGHFMSA